MVRDVKHHRRRPHDSTHDGAPGSFLVRNSFIFIVLTLTGTFILPALPGTSAPRPAQNPTAEVERIVDGLNRYLAEVRDMSADFVQIQDNGLNQPRREEGHVYLHRSRKMRWEYDRPEVKIYVVDGDRESDYLPGENLLRRRRVDERFYDQVPLMSILGRQNVMDEVYQTRLLPIGTPEARVEGARALRLVPRRESDVQDIFLEVDPESFDIRRLKMTYVNGDTTDFVFSNVQTNIGLSDALWEIVPAPGTDIVDMVN